jgi:hypothetical protein
MHRIDHATATVDNQFTEGDPVGGIAATVMTDDWANAVQEEICEVIETAGLTLNKADNTQLLAALVAMGVRASSTSQTGVVELATSAEVQTGTDTVRAVTPSGLASFAKSFSSQGYAKLPGGLIIQWGQVTATPNPGTAVTFPIAFPTAALCIAGSDYVSSVSSPLYTQAAYNVTASGFTMLSTGSSEVAYWMALGY